MPSVQISSVSCPYIVDPTLQLGLHSSFFLMPLRGQRRLFGSLAWFGLQTNLEARRRCSRLPRLCGQLSLHPALAVSLGNGSSHSQRPLTLVERIFSVKLAVFMETQAVFIKEQRTTSSPVTQGVECLASVFKHGTGKAEEEQLLRSLFLFGAVAAFAPLEPRFHHEAEKQYLGTPRVPFVFTHMTRMVQWGQRREGLLSPSLQRRKLRTERLNNTEQMI